MSAEQSKPRRSTQERTRRVAWAWWAAGLIFFSAALGVSFDADDASARPTILVLIGFYCVTRADHLFGWAKGYVAGLIVGQKAAEARSHAEAYAEGWQDAHDLARLNGWK